MPAPMPDAGLAALDRCFPDPPSVLGVAVSGGSDSTALLALCVAWGRARVRAVTVDHGLRPEAAAEAEAVARICADLGVAHDVLRWRDWDGAGNLQDQARRARYRLLSGWGRGAGVGHIALGHTRDDQAETFLIGLARSAGLDGLSGMRPTFARDGVRFHRPLLGLSRAGLRAYLRSRGIAWLEDPGNVDARFDRVRARAAMSALAGLDIDSARLARTIANLRDTRDAIGAMLATWSGSHVGIDRGDVLIDPDGLGALPRDFARRVLNAGLRLVSGADYPPRAEAVLAVLDGADPSQTLHGCLITRAEGTLRIAREPAAAAGAPPARPGEVWDGRWILGAGGDAGQVRALGDDGLARCPDWRGVGLPRSSLAASPALWQGPALRAAPLAGLGPDTRLRLAAGRDEFAAFLVSH